MNQLKKFAAYAAMYVSIVIVAFIFSVPNAFAAVTVTPASGGSAISADTNLANGTTSWTPLTGPTIAEDSNRSFPASGTFIFNVPTGFNFNTSSAVTATITRLAGTGTCFRFSSASVTPTATTITFSLAARDQAGSTRCQVVFSGIQVRPTAGTPLASGNITKSGTASVSGITNGVTNLGTLTEVAGAKNKLIITTQPSATATAGSQFITKPIIAIEDQYGNTVTSDSATTIARIAVLSSQSCGGTSGSGTLSSTPVSGATVSSGVMVYTAMSYSKAEDIKICFTSTGITSALSNTISVSPGAVDHFVVTNTSGSAIGSQSVNTPFDIKIVAQDANNDTATSFTGTVTLSNALGGITPTTSGSFVSGVLASQSVTLSVVGTDSVTVTALGKSGTSNSFSVSAGSIDHFVITDTSGNSIGSQTAGVPFNIKIVARDFYNNLATSFSNTATLSNLLGNITPTISELFNSGVLASQSVTLSVVGTDSVTATYSGKTGTSNTFLVVQPNNPVPTITSISPTAREAGSSGFSLIVDGTNFIASSTVKWNNSEKTTVYASSTRVAATILAGDIATSGTATVVVHNPTPGGGDSNSVSFTITTPPPPATKFVIINPSDSTVGTGVVVTVQAQDAIGNIVSTYQNDVTLIANGHATGAGLVSISDGVGTLVINDETAETVILSLSDSESTGLDVSSTQNVIFSPGSTFQFALNSPGSGNADTRSVFTVSRHDQFGNTTTIGTSTIYLYTNSASGLGGFYGAATGGSIINSVAINVGSSETQFWYQEGRVGNYSITVSDNPSMPDGAAGIADASADIAISAGATNKFILNNPGDMTVGNRLGYIVTRKDSFDNLVTSGSQFVYLYSGSPSPTKAFYDNATGGSPLTRISILDGVSSANFWYFDDTAGTYTITASDSATAPDGTTGIIDGFDDVTVGLVPITATKLIIEDPTDDIAGNVVPVTIRAVDDANALDTSFNNTVTLNTTGSALGGSIVTLFNGIGTANITDQTAETVTLSLTDTGATGLNTSSTQTVVFSPGSTSQFVINDPGDTSAGTRLNYTVTRKDRFGNLVISGISTVYVYTNSTGLYGKFYDAATGGNLITSINIAAGQSLANFWYEEGTVGSWIVTVSDNNKAPDDATGIADASDAVVIAPGSTYIFILNNPGTMTAGSRASYTVRRTDSFGNPTIANTESAYLFSSSSSANKKFYDAATGGNPIFSIPIVSGVSSANFWYFDDTAGTYTITASDSAGTPNGAVGIIDGTDAITVNTAPIVATRLVISANSSATIGSVVNVTITAEDNNGNIDTTFTGDVTLNTTGMATGADIVHVIAGVGRINIIDAEAELVTLSLLDTASTGLDVSSTKNINFVSAPVASVILGGGGTAVSTPSFAIRFQGNAFPGANINILGIPEGSTAAEAVTLKQQSASRNGSFNLGITNPDAKSNFYIATLTDKNNTQGQTKVFAKLSDTAIVRNIVFAPTLTLFRNSVRLGDYLRIEGFGNPNDTIQADIDGVMASETTPTGSDGSYTLLINTANLSLGQHTVRVKSSKSDFSLSKSFLVSDIFRTGADLNNDGKIDVRDMNIFVSSWVSSNPDSKLKADLNNDGKVDLQDLSIFAQSLQK